MKRLLIAVCVICAVALAADAAPGKEKGKKEGAADQKALKKQILEKYDANKDGKLDRAERAKISAEDKAKLEKAGLGQKRKKDKDAK